MTGPTRRSLILSSLAAAGLAQTGGALAAEPAKPKRIFMVLPRPDVGDAIGFQSYLGSVGLPVDYVMRIVGSDPVKIQAALDEIRATKPDLVFSIFTQIAQALAGGSDDKATPLGDIPLVFSSVTDPVSAGLVRTLSGHGRNVTGARHVPPVEAQLKVLRSYREFDRLAVVYNAAEANMEAIVAELQRFAAEWGFTLIAKPVPIENGVPRGDLLPQLIAEAAKEGADFLYIGPDNLVASRNSPVVATAALAHRLPTFCATELPIKTANVLVGLVSRAFNVGGLAGYKAHQILAQGRAARDIPIETLQRFSLVLRMSVARELDLYPPMRLLKIAEVNTDPLIKHG